MGEQEGIARDLRQRLAIRYAIEGDLRFLSHQDSLRMFQRAFARAGIPIRYSEGFNPRPSISIVLPRPVGVASQDERLIVELSSFVALEDVISRLSAQLPEGIQIRGASELNRQDRCAPVEVEYSVPIEESIASDVASAAAEFLAQKHVWVERVKIGSPARKVVDVRSFIRDMQLTRGELCWSQSVSQDGTARVGEVLDIIGLPARDRLHRVVRQRAIYRD